MVEVIGAVVAAVLRIGLPIYLASLIATALLLFLPDSTANTLGLVEFRNIYREWLGAGFIISASLISAEVLLAIGRIFVDRLDARRFRRRTLETLRMLTPAEKSFLRPYIAEGANTVYAPISDGISGGLAAKEIIYRSSNIVQFFKAPYNLQPGARKILTQDPHLLD